MQVEGHSRTQMDSETRNALQKLRELSHFVAFLEKVPEFPGSRVVSFDPDERPDVVCRDERGNAVGVEVTQWLMAKQKKAAALWDAILCAGSKIVALPQNVTSANFSFRSSVKFFLDCDGCADFLGRLSLSGVAKYRHTSAINDYSEYSRCGSCDQRFRGLASQRAELEAEVAAILSAALRQTQRVDDSPLVKYDIPRGQFRMADEFSLGHLCLSLGQPRRSPPRPIFELGGAYAPGLAASALTHRRNDKLTKQSYADIRASKGLSKAFLLVVYDDAILENTPFEPSSPFDVASAAVKRWPGLFDGVFLLLYPNNPLAPYELVPGVLLGGRECYWIDPLR
jgi:hypothetical protein